MRHSCRPLIDFCPPDNGTYTPKLSQKEKNDKEAAERVQAETDEGLSHDAILEKCREELTNMNGRMREAHIIKAMVKLIEDQRVSTHNGAEAHANPDESAEESCSYVQKTVASNGQLSERKAKTKAIKSTTSAAAPFPGSDIDFTTDWKTWKPHSQWTGDDEVAFAELHGNGDLFLKDFMEYDCDERKRYAEHIMRMGTIMRYEFQMVAETAKSARSSS